MAAKRGMAGDIAEAAKCQRRLLDKNLKINARKKAKT